MIDDLADLRGPVTGLVELPLRLFWSLPDHRFDLDEPDLRRWYYETVLREATRPADLAAYLDGETLVSLWPELYLPKGVRRGLGGTPPGPASTGERLMPLNDLHRRVATIALRAANRYGFALGGGNALIAHGLIDRPTQDVDLFTNEEDGVVAAARSVQNALQRAGFEAEREGATAELADVLEGMGDGLAEWTVTAPDGQRTMLQLAYFDRAAQPVTMDVGPVLNLEDVIGGKVCALASRAEPRDFIDTAAALEHYTVDQVIAFARRLDPGLEERDFADAGRRLDRWGDAIFAPFGLGPAEVAALRAAFAGWPR